MDQLTAIQTAKIIAVPVPFLLAGYSAAFSQAILPQIYDKSAHLSVPLVVGIFQRGAAVVVPGALAVAAAAGYLAYTLPAQRTTWTVVAVAAMFPPVFTRFYMMQSNISRLLEISGSERLLEKATANLEARQLLKKWNGQNWVRASVSLLAGLVAVKATLGQ